VRGLPRLYHYQVIIWLNGTFGVGKSSTAERLAALVPGSRVLDPDSVGQLLRVNLGDLPGSDFQDWAAWRPLVAATLIEVARMTGQHVIAPMTVLKREYLDQIFGPVRAAELDVFHVVLDASDTVLRSRIELTQDGQEWRLAHLEEYGQARGWMTAGADFVVDTAASTPAQIARKIFAALPDMPDLPAQPVVVPRPRANGQAGAAAGGKPGAEPPAKAGVPGPALSGTAPSGTAPSGTAPSGTAVSDKVPADKGAAEQPPSQNAVVTESPGLAEHH
jgi:chloramphenicol 3-O-phosphotransferase